MNQNKSFFSLKNTVQEISESDIKQTANYIETIEALTRITNSSVYVIDYEKKGFDYVSDNPLFLCGNSAEEVKQMGYNFYFKNVPEKDLDLLLLINTAGFDFYEKIPKQERKNYTISYDFLLQTIEDRQILINQKLTPLFLTQEGKIWKAICIVSLSSQKNSGNIIISNNSGNETFYYDLEKNCWKKLQKIVISEREKEILRFSIRGYSINEIAEKIFISPDTVKFHRKKLFEKLDVSNISEAISFVTKNKII